MGPVLLFSPERRPLFLGGRWELHCWQRALGWSKMLLCAAGGLYTTEESLPLTTVSFRAPCTALVYTLTLFLSLREYECVSAHESPACFQCCPSVFFFIFTSGCYSSAGRTCSMRSDSACLPRWSLYDSALEVVLLKLSIVLSKGIFVSVCIRAWTPKRQYVVCRQLPRNKGTAIHFSSHTKIKCP